MWKLKPITMKIDNLNLFSLLWRSFAFICLPTLLTELFIFLLVYSPFKIFGFLKAGDMLFNAFFIILLFQSCFWIHEFGHIVIAHFLKQIDYVVKVPFKYRFFEVCFMAGIFNKPEGKGRFLCAISGPGANLILGLLFLALYFYTNIILFYTGFVMNIIIFCINLLPLSVSGFPFDGKNICQELALFMRK